MIKEQEKEEMLEKFKQYMKERAYGYMETSGLAISRDKDRYFFKSKWEMRERAMELALEYVQEIEEKSKKYIDTYYAEGWNDCLDELINRIKDDLENY